MQELDCLDRYGMLIILRYDFDWGSLGESICLASIQRELLTYFSITYRSEGLAILLVEITISLLSLQIKLAIMFDLMLLSNLLILTTWVLESLTKLFTLSMLMGTMTYLHEDSLIVILKCGLGLLLSLIIFWTCLIFLFWRLGNASLIFSVSLATFDLLKFDNAWA